MEYMKGETPNEGAAFTVVEGYSYPIQTFQGVVTNTSWYVNYIFSYTRQTKGNLASNVTAFKAMSGFN